MAEDPERAVREALKAADFQWSEPDSSFTYVTPDGESLRVTFEVSPMPTSKTGTRAKAARLFGDELARELRHEMRERIDDFTSAGHSPEELGSPADLARRVVRQLPLTPSPLEDLTGPFYDTPSLAKWLGVTRQALDSRVRNKTLLGLPMRDGPRVYPAWQFGPDKSTLPYFANLLKILAAGTSDAWTWALWLSAPSESHDGLTAYEWLAKGHDPELLLAEARADAARWAA